MKIKLNKFWRAFLDYLLQVRPHLSIWRLRLNDLMGPIYRYFIVNQNTILSEINQYINSWMKQKQNFFFFIDNNFKIWDMSYLLHYETFYLEYMRKKWKQHVINSCVRIAFLIMNLNVPSHNDVLLLLVSRSKRFAFFYVDLDVQCRLLNWFNI